MVDAPQIQYRNEYIQGYERRVSLLRETTTTEAIIKGNQAVFLVADSGDATTTTRGVDGLIPARTDTQTQYTATLTEQHDLVKKTGFNIFASQSDQRRMMQVESLGVVNRKMDDQIITELNTATQDSGTAEKASMAFVMYGRTVLGNNDVVNDGNITALITPAFEAYILQMKEFTSADYVAGQPLLGKGGYYNWLNMKWIVHTGLPGIGTNVEKCFLYHKSAIGHAMDTGGLKIGIGYDEEQDYSYARHTFYAGPKLLQNEGVFVWNHDGSEFAPQ